MKSEKEIKKELRQQHFHMQILVGLVVIALYIAFAKMVYEGEVLGSIILYSMVIFELTLFFWSIFREKKHGLHPKA